MGEGKEKGGKENKAVTMKTLPHWEVNGGSPIELRGGEGRRKRDEEEKKEDSRTAKGSRDGEQHREKEKKSTKPSRQGGGMRKSKKTSPGIGPL